MLTAFLMGPGRWLVLNVMTCDNPEQYDLLFDISRKKINRTHDCFDIHINLDRVIDNTYRSANEQTDYLMIEIDVYQKVDGGFKYYQTIADESACKFLMRQAEANVKRLLASGNIDPPECPLQAGLIEIKNYVFDYRELPKTGVYGTFEAHAYIVYKGIRMGCTKVFLNFDEDDDDEDDDDDYDDDGLF
ncbi:unnamed protein product [Spodoptera exigua]|nr:unnamed protein product [Spodoptera exigua]